MFREAVINLLYDRLLWLGLLPPSPHPLLTMNTPPTRWNRPATGASLSALDYLSPEATHSPPPTCHPYGSKRQVLACVAKHVRDFFPK